MAVAYVSDIDATPATGTTITYSSFAVSGSNPTIVVLVAMDLTAGVATVSSVVCSAGLSGTAALVKANTASTNSYEEIWAIAAPAGTGTITVTLSASRPWQSTAILFSGADQTTPCPTGDAVVTNGTGSSPLSATASNLTANDAAVGVGSNSNAGDAPTILQTQTFNSNSTSVNAAAGYHLGTGAMTCSWGTPTVVSQLMAARVAATSAAGSTFTPAQGAAALTGKGTALGFAINMPDEP